MIAFLYDREKVIPLIRLRVAISSGVLKVIVTLFCVTQVLAAITQYFLLIFWNPSSINILLVPTLVAFPLIVKRAIWVVGFDPFDISILALKGG